MNQAPIFRRSGFVATFSLAIACALYAWALRAADVSDMGRSFFSYLILIIGFFSAIGLLSFSAYLMAWVRDTRQMLTAVLRILILIVWAGLNLFVLFSPEYRTLYTILTHLDLALITLLITIALTAQFTLPVKGQEDRLAVIRRLIGFLVGERGPATFIRSGKAEEAHDERLRRAPGVVLVDYASACVLRTDTRFTRSIGPGVHFTDRGEWRAESLDLRPQVRMVEGSPPVTGEPVETGGINTYAITRDGIPISADLAVIFMLDPGHTNEPRYGRFENIPPYEYHQQSAERAVYGHAFGEFEDMSANELPLRLAIDLWRELVKEKTLEELIGKDPYSPSSLEEIKNQILIRLTSPSTEKDQETGEVPQEHREFQVLHDRGIRVLAVEGISNPYLPDEVRLERMRIWRENWAGAVQQSLAEANETVKRIRFEGEMEACGTLLRDLSHDLRSALKDGQKPSKRDTIMMVIDDAINLCSDHPQIADSANLAIQLKEIRRELETLDGDCTQISERGP